MAIRVAAKVRGLGQHYSDGLEMLSVDVKKVEADGLRYRDGARIPITLQLGRESYQAGVRTTSRMSTVWISPDLVDSSGERTKLARVLARHGLLKNQPVFLYVDDAVVRLTPVSQSSA
jgi:hypothetical protein